MPEDKIEEITKKFNSDLNAKDEEIKKLNALISKRDTDERVTKINSVFKEFKYEDSMSNDYLDGFIAGIEVEVNTKKNGGVDIPPIVESDSGPKVGLHTTDEDEEILKNLGDQI